MTVLVSLDRNLIFAKLQLTELTADQKETIWQLILDIFQTRLIDLVLSDLDNEADKRKFLWLLTSAAEDELRQFLVDKIENIETRIQNLISEITDQLGQEVLAARRESQ